MKPWQGRTDILKLRAYACEVAVSLLVDGKSVEEDCRNLMAQYAIGNEASFKIAAYKILNQVLKG
jgi:hypothetical protein